PRSSSIALLLLAVAACTSTVTTAEAPSPQPSATPSTSASTSPAASPAASPSPDLVLIRPRENGSLRIHGTYPPAASECQHPEQPRLETRYPGTLAVRRASDGTLDLTVTL